MSRLRLIFTAVGAITGYIFGGMLGMDWAAKHNPEFAFLGLSGHLAGAAVGAGIGAVGLALFVYLVTRNMPD